MSPVDDLDLYVPGGTRVDYVNGGWSAEAEARYYSAAASARVRPFIGGAVGVYRWTEFEQSELQPLASLYAGAGVSLSRRLSASAQLRASRYSDEPFERRFDEALNSISFSIGLRVQPPNPEGVATGFRINHPRPLHRHQSARTASSISSSMKLR